MVIKSLKYLTSSQLALFKKPTSSSHVSPFKMKMGFFVERDEIGSSGTTFISVTLIFFIEFIKFSFHIHIAKEFLRQPESVYSETFKTRLGYPHWSVSVGDKFLCIYDASNSVSSKK